MKRALITGCGGFIGSHLARFLLDREWKIVGLDNLSRVGGDFNLVALRSAGDFSFEKADVRDFPAVQRIFQEDGPFDLVAHQAGQVAVTTSVQSPREDFEINALGTLNLLEATRAHSPDAFFEFASTNKVYGRMTDIEVVERGSRYDYAEAAYGIAESYPLDFYSPYGCSKGCADQYVRDYSRIFGVKTVVLRQSCIYGTRQFGIEDQGWVAWFTIASILGRPLTIFGDGKQIRDVLWVDDLVRAYLALYEARDRVCGEVFNIGGGPAATLSLLELVDLLREDGALAQTPRFGDWRPGDQKVFVCDIRKVEKAVGWTPSISPREGVKRLLEWVRAHRSEVEAVIHPDIP